MNRLNILQRRLEKLATIHDNAGASKLSIEYRARITYCTAAIKNEMKAIIATKKMVITIDSQPDALGRQNFYAIWFFGPNPNDMASGEFVAKVDNFIATWRKLGYYVIVDDKFSKLKTA